MKFTPESKTQYASMARMSANLAIVFSNMANYWAEQGETANATDAVAAAATQATAAALYATKAADPPRDDYHEFSLYLPLTFELGEARSAVQRELRRHTCTARNCYDASHKLLLSMERSQGIDRDVAAGDATLALVGA